MGLISASNDAADRSAKGDSEIQFSERFKRSELQPLGCVIRDIVKEFHPALAAMRVLLG